jgi:hypothetical protein
MAIKKTNNKKMYITGGIILGVAGLAYLFRNQIKNLFTTKSEFEDTPQNEIPYIAPDIIVPSTKEKTAIPDMVPKKNTKAEDATKEKKKVISEIDKKLKKGDKNKNVKDLQYNIREILSILKLPLINANGIFDDATDKALLKISSNYKENGFFTIRRARETSAKYAGEKGLRFPSYLSTTSNVADLQKIYQTGLVKYRLGSFTNVNN